jgi:hypothetical protein
MDYSTNPLQLDVFREQDGYLKIKVMAEASSDALGVL